MFFGGRWYFGLWRKRLSNLAVRGNYKDGVIFFGGNCFGGRRFSVFGGIFLAVDCKYNIRQCYFGGNAARRYLFCR